MGRVTAGVVCKQGTNSVWKMMNRPESYEIRIEGVSLSGEMAPAGLHQAENREGAHITAQATPSVAHRRILYDTEARGSQRDTK
jgi:hypothetical protein